MPRNAQLHRNLHDLPLKERRALDREYQKAWYEHVAALPGIKGKSVLDVGAGSGYGIPILAAGGASRVHGIDPLPAGHGVSPTPIEEIGTRSFDWVVAMDVIEHVEDDEDFLAQLVRVAETVFFSTPNWNCSRCTNPFHVREYTPAELRTLLLDYDDLCRRVWLGDARWNIVEVKGIDDAELRNNFGVLLSPEKA